MTFRVVAWLWLAFVVVVAVFVALAWDGTFLDYVTFLFSLPVAVVTVWLMETKP